MQKRPYVLHKSDPICATLHNGALARRLRDGIFARRARGTERALIGGMMPQVIVTDRPLYQGAFVQIGETVYRVRIGASSTDDKATKTHVESFEPVIPNASTYVIPAKTVPR